MALPINAPYPPIEALSVEKFFRENPGALNRNGMAFVASRSKPLIKPPGFTGNAPGGPNRWSTNRSSEWQLVVEVQYDHFTGNRFRHGTNFYVGALTRRQKRAQWTKSNPWAELSRGKF
jgi:hypothetical protein